ncbi:MAG: methyltransferase domain-containing protein [Caldilineaceae bacterium]
MIVLSHFQAKQLLTERKTGAAQTKISPDLGLNVVTVQLEAEAVRFPSGVTLAWPQIERILEKENGCFEVDADGMEEIRIFSEATNRYCSLYPTRSAPTIVIAGFPMHRIKESDPKQDTLEKIKSVAPITGRVLDTTMGLGYTAIEAARSAEHVTTIELDPAVIEIAQRNPWSQDLFTRSNIEVRNGDSFEEIRAFADASFDRILHDPPVFALAGELYSAEFYGELWRVLKPKGRLFHYIGNPDSASGNRVTKGVIRRLQDVGFRNLRDAAKAFGVVAVK